MNQSPKSQSLSHRFALATGLFVLLAASGCGKEDSQNAQTSVAAPPSKPAIVSAEQTSFSQVTSQLDPGGSLYGYLSTSQWLDGLSGRVAGWRDAALSLPGMGEPEKANVNKAFDLIAGLIKASGIESATGIGISGIALGKGFYQTKFVVQRDTNSPAVGIWSVFGRAPRPLYEIDWLPADTAWAVFSDVDLKSIWSAVTAEVRKFPDAEAGLGQLYGHVESATGKKLDDFLGSLGGQAGVFLTLNDARKVQIPLPGGPSIELPEPGLVMVFKVRDDTLFDWIDRILQQNPGVISSDEGGLRMRTMPIPVPLPITLRLAIARQGEHLFIASNDELIRSVMAVKSGKQPGLKAGAEFQRLARAMTLDGNSLTFVSQRFGQLVQTIQSSVLAQMRGTGGDAPTALLQKVYSINQAVSSLVIGRSTPNGWLTIGHGTQQPANAVVLPLVVAPMAIIAGMTLPALAKAKTKAQTISCVSNLKQMGLGARLYAADHNGDFPPDLLSMKDQLGTPRVLICPLDPSASASVNLTWDKFANSQSTYEYVTRGLTESTPGAEMKVLFRCRIHGNVCMGDGSVRTANSATPPK